MKTDAINYEELERRILEREYGSIVTICYVAGCDYDIGISIVYDNNRKKEAMCIHGKSSPFYKQYCDDIVGYADNYDEAFKFVIESIRKGKLDSNKLDKIFNINDDGGTTYCAYKG